MLNISDPLALLAIESGQVNNPSRQDGAAGGSRLDVEQRSVRLGEPVPIVFALRRNNKGGILVSPGATECRFENDTLNAVTAFYHLVISEGRIDPIQVRDVFQRACRVGTHTQVYGMRAGAWTPGNYFQSRVGYQLPEATYNCGTIGLYPDMTSVSFQHTVPNGFDQWKRQVHLFIRGGMHVKRLLDGNSVGPSDNFADLVRWLLESPGRVPTPLIDTEQLEATALFLEENGLTCNCQLKEATNYSDFVAKWAPYFLVIPSNRGGKKGLRPILPVNEDGTIKTTPVDIEYTFTEDLIQPGTFEVDYTNYADRQPFVAQMTWRQELGNEAAIIRTTEIRLPGTAEVGPYESHDLSEFCTSEDHAVKAGAYILADRAYSTHAIRFAPRPESHITELNVGSIIRVRLLREAANSQACHHDYLYQVQRISKTFAGDTQYDCRHFPVDDQLRSIVALHVAAAYGTGILLESPTTGISCDLNSASNTSVPPGVGITQDDGGNDVIVGSGQVPVVIGPGGESITIGGISFPVVTITGGGDGVIIGGEEFPVISGSGGDYVDLGDGVIIGTLTGSDTAFGSGTAIGAGMAGIGGGGGGGGSISGGAVVGGEENLPVPTATEGDGLGASPLGTLTPTGEPGEFETPPGLCSGAVITYTTADLDPETGAIITSTLTSQVVSGWTIPFANLGNNKYHSFTVACGDGSSQYADPVIVTEEPWNEIESGTVQLLYTVTTDDSELVACDEGNSIYNRPASSSTNSFTSSQAFNSTAWRPATNSATINYVCPPGGTSLTSVPMGIWVRNSSGGETLLGYWTNSGQTRKDLAPFIPGSGSRITSLSITAVRRNGVTIFP
jgi:hypothetical protein